MNLRAGPGWMKVSMTRLASLMDVVSLGLVDYRSLETLTNSHKAMSRVMLHTTFARMKSEALSWRSFKSEIICLRDCPKSRMSLSSSVKAMLMPAIRGPLNMNVMLLTCCVSR